jgi:hypothetical protein
MSEQDVTNLMGQASQSSLSTCGQNVGKPWQCKVWTYGMGGPFGNSLSVAFGQNETARGSSMGGSDDGRLVALDYSTGVER